MKLLNKIIIPVLMLLTFIVSSQNLKYDILARNDKIGVLNVVQTKVNDEHNFKISADVSVKIVSMVHVKYRLNCTYKNDVLTHSNITTYVNNKLHSSSKLSRKNGIYTHIKDGKEHKWNMPVHYSSVKLHIIEPTDILNVFSENLGENKLIKKTGNKHLYKLMHPKKKKQIEEYEYKNGVLQKVTIHHPILMFHLVKVK